MRRLLSIVSVASLAVLSSCGGGSPAAPTPTPTPRVINGVLAVSVLSAYGTREANGVKLHVTVRYLETAGGSTTLLRIDLAVKQNGVAVATYESTESHIIGAKGSLEIEYTSDEANNDPYPTSVEATATYNDSAGAVKTATASSTFTPLPPG